MAAHSIIQPACAAEAQDDGQLKETLEAAAKERADMFESMYESEQKIRLGEAGWKARYYEVRALACQPVVKPADSDPGACASPPVALRPTVGMRAAMHAVGALLLQQLAGKACTPQRQPLLQACGTQRPRTAGRAAGASSARS